MHSLIDEMLSKEWGTFVLFKYLENYVYVILLIAIQWILSTSLLIEVNAPELNSIAWSEKNIHYPCLCLYYRYTSL